jgi:hypothetical protein
MTNKPVDKKLYENVKKRLYKKMPTHSAYRSGLLVSNYKKQFKNKYGNRKRPYTGDKKKNKATLTRWFNEKWRNQRGEVGFKKKGDIYRPTKRITKKTPITFNELNKTQIKKAMKEKKKTGRVKNFSKIKY